MGVDPSTPRVLVGLGNPGESYERTRHNLGFLLLDALARAEGLSWRPEKRFQAMFSTVSLGGRPILLLKPMTFVNLSGESLASVARYYRWGPSSFVVAHDDINLPPFRVKLSQSGGDGGHNGLRDIIHRLGDAFIRFRIGIGGRPDRRMDLKDWVLGRLSEPDEQTISGEYPFWRDALELLFTEGPVRAMNFINSKKTES